MLSHWTHSLMCQEEEEDGPSTSTDPAEGGSAAAAPAAAQEAGKQGGKGKKKSGEDIIEREKERSKKAKEAATKKAEWFELKQNTSVYVSGLPSDVTEEEVAQVMKQSGPANCCCLPIFASLVSELCAALPGAHLYCLCLCSWHGQLQWANSSSRCIGAQLLDTCTTNMQSAICNHDQSSPLFAASTPCQPALHGTMCCINGLSCYAASSQCTRCQNHACCWHAVCQCAYDVGVMCATGIVGVCQVRRYQGG